MKTPPLALLAALALQATVSASLAQETGQAVFDKGRTALHRGDLALARRCFEELLKAKPDFELAKIHLAQVAAAERELAKIPRSLKVARGSAVERVSMDKVTLEDATGVFVRELQRAGSREGEWNVTLTENLPLAVKERPVSLIASGLLLDDFLEALGVAGGVQFSYTAEGITAREVRGARGQYDAGNPKQPGMDAAAKKITINRLVLDGASAGEALDYLAHKAAELSGGKVKPLFVMRHGCSPRGRVTLDLRNVSLYDAVRSVCLVLDLEEMWFPWGAGIGSRTAAAAAAVPAVVDKPAK